MAKKKHQEEHENLERWLVSYADFITLLFAFFTVLYALSQSDKAKYKDAVESIQRAFVSAGGVFSLKGVPFSPFDKSQDNGGGTPTASDEVSQLSYEQNEMQERVADQLKGLFKQTTGLSLSPGSIEVVRTETGYRIRLGEYLLFSPGSDKIKASNLPFVYAIGKRLAKMGHAVQVEGHSDTSAHVSEEANWQLSMTRAFNVVQFLVEGVKFPPNKLSMAGFGDKNPIAPNDSSHGRQRNRRVELVVTINEGRSDGDTWENIEF